MQNVPNTRSRASDVYSSTCALHMQHVVAFMSAFRWEDIKTSIWGLRFQDHLTTLEWVFWYLFQIILPSGSQVSTRTVEMIWSFNRGNMFTGHNITKHWTIWGGINLS